MPNQTQPQPSQLNIKADDATLRGVYTNMMMVTHTPETFVLDFVNVAPPQPFLVARVITNPGHLKRMIAALSENLKRYEASFGTVTPSAAPSSEIGFRG